MLFDNYKAEIIDRIHTDIDYVGIGDGASALVKTDTLLSNETLRKLASKTLDDNSIVFDGYWDETEGNGVTYTECAVFWNGATSTIDTGDMAFGGQINITKDSTQTLTVSVEITIEEV